MKIGDNDNYITYPQIRQALSDIIKGFPIVQTVSEKFNKIIGPVNKIKVYALSGWNHLATRLGEN